MHHLLVAAAILTVTQICDAEPSQEVQERMAAALFQRFPCEKFEDKSNRNECDHAKKAMAARISLSKAFNDSKTSSPQSDSEWQTRYRETAEQLQDFRDEEARLRNRLKPKIGMTKDYIYRHVMGPPDSINETESASGMSSQWIYEDDVNTQYLYFNSKGILSVIQRRR